MSSRRRQETRHTANPEPGPSREFIRDLTTAMEDSRHSATEDLATDAIIQLTGLANQPKIREKLLALIGIDDMQAAEVDPTMKKIYEGIKNALELNLYNVEETESYEKAMTYIDNAGVSLDVYQLVLPIHMSMVDAEREEEECLRMQIEEARSKEAERMRDEAEKKADLDRRRRQAWLGRFTSSAAATQ